LAEQGYEEELEKDFPGKATTGKDWKTRSCH